jgi:hypothetical protein
MILKGNIVTLRPIEEGDLEFVREIFNNPEIESMVVGWSGQYPCISTANGSSK